MRAAGPRGQASYESHDDELALHGVHAVLADVRNDCKAAISVRIDVPGEGTERAAIYRVRHDLYLCQDVGREGLHRFTCLSPEQQAGWLAATIDAFHLVRDDNGPIRTPSSNSASCPPIRTSFPAAAAPAPS